MQSLSKQVPSTSTIDSTRPLNQQRRFTWGSMPTTVRRGLLLVLLIGAWQAYVSISGVNPLLVASPIDVGRALWEGIKGGELLTFTLTTLRILGLGMLIGITVAALFTTLATWSKVGADLLALLTAMINPLPGIAILPLAILWFGLKPSALIFVIANAVIWPVAINVTTGFRTVNPTILMVARNLGLRGFKLVREVLMPAALPYTITGIRTGWAFGWRTIIAAELVFGVAGSNAGLGAFINEARYFLQIPNVFAGLVLIAVIGILFEYLFNQIEARTVVRWGMKSGS